MDTFVAPRKDSATTSSFKIFADLLIPGDGDPIPNALLITKNNKIIFVGKAADHYDSYNNNNNNNDNNNNNNNNNDTNSNDDENKNSDDNNRIKTIHVPVIMPGMWDCHVHFIGYTKNITTDLVNYSVRVEPELAIVRSIKQCKQALYSGFTSVREVGGMGYYLKQLIKEGTIIGPNIYHCGKALSITSGACDDARYKYEYMHNNNCCPSIIGEICNGKNECILGVRKQIRKNADCIKIFTTGAVMSSIGNVNERQFNDEEISCIVNEAKQTGRVVAAHAHGKEGILSAINNGVKTIEHGTYIDQNICNLMNEKNVIFVPTRWIYEHIIGNIINNNNKNENENENKKEQKVAIDESILKGKKAYKIHENGLKLAIKNNVTIACGTDMFVDEWGTNGKELIYYVKYGMSELNAIKCATANGPLTLGNVIAPKSGQLKVGYDADIIALSKNPLKNISVLSEPNNIVIVWKNGKIEKNIWKSSGKSML